MRDATVQFRCGVFFENFVNGSHREYPGTNTSCNHCHTRQCFIKAAVVPCVVNFLEEKVCGLYDFIWSHVRLINDLCVCDWFSWSFGSMWDYFCKLSIFVVHMFHSTSRPFFFDHGPSLRTIRKNCIRNVLHVNWRRCYNVSGTSGKLPTEDVTTRRERLASHLKKMLQRIRNVLQVTWGRCYNVSGTFCNLLEKMLQRSRKPGLTTQIIGRYYTPSTPPPPKKMCKSDNSPLHGRRHPKKNKSQKDAFF